MINCPECGNSISSLAKRCVHCGATMYPIKAIEGEEITLQYHDFKLWINGKKITKYVGDAEEIDLSSLNVDTLENDLFRGNKFLRVITLPHSLTIIPARAFYDCSSLNSVNIGYQVTQIGDAAFYGCTSLEKIVFPASVSYIGGSIFAGCSALKEFVLPNDTNLKCIPSGAFASCDSLENMYLPYGIDRIEDIAFKNCKSLHHINIPISVKFVSENVFANCYNLEYHYHENGLYLGNEENPFYLLVKLNDVFCTYLNVHDWCNEIAIGALGNASMLETLVTPTLGNSANGFAQLYGMDLSLQTIKVKELIIKEGIQEIKQVINQSTIEKLVIPNSVTSMSVIPFSNLNEKAYNKDGDAYYLGNDSNPYLVLVKYKYDSWNRSYNIKDGTRFIQNNAFYNVKNLERIYIPNSVIEIGNSVFNTCNKLKEATFQEGCNLKYIGDGLFSGCYELENLKLPGCGFIIGREAFADCRKITYLNISEGVTVIRDKAFFRCDALEYISLPSSINTILEQVFTFDNAIKKIDFNKSRYDARDFSWKYSGLANPSVIHFNDDFDGQTW